ncbi:hypothetical protein MOX02_27430 [Methylobacterium oxalidis]|uniref:Uncharacterized protein n=1 Tax=Methylobacterium oxalidis TaxID=944322 RepID=A0A512J422_9HYPH|nr:hypothetical protein MOX02_27430 [Methylobacterium oxalidis]GLS63240.1 hypothetical protein GCM10007888_16210 [Methylobacterium oxalidis]
MSGAMVVRVRVGPETRDAPGRGPEAEEGRGERQHQSESGRPRAEEGRQGEAEARGDRAPATSAGSPSVAEK